MYDDIYTPAFRDAEQSWLEPPDGACIECENSPDECTCQEWDDPRELEYDAREDEIREMARGL